MGPSAFGTTDPGRQRDVNEDRVYVNPAHGLFIVVDGVGGQAAGGRAADIAVQRLRSELERERAPSAQRVREAITEANNEIYRTAAGRPEWQGMACVLTVMAANSERAVVGHVGDTRLYRITAEGVDKITRDHSPIGEREDTGQISEFEAMHHPRRNEVYRDVGSELHAANDPDFIDVQDIALDRADAFLLCSDGLSDLVDADTIHRVVVANAGDPARVARALVDAANQAGGKDNITVAYVEGERFPARVAEHSRTSEITRRLGDTQAMAVAGARGGRWRRALSLTALAASFLLAGASLARIAPAWFDLWQTPPAPIAGGSRRLVVKAGQSINEALQNAAAGSEVIVEAGEYRERIAMASGVRLIADPPRGAIIRLPGSTADSDAAVVATDVIDGELRGFQIVGDATSPLGTGVQVERSTISLVDVEIAGATRSAIEVGAQSRIELLGSDLHDNPGSALVLRQGSAARIGHSTLAKNGGSELAGAPFVIDPGAALDFTGNTLHGVPPSAFSALGDRAMAIERDNWFLGIAPKPATAPARGAARGRR